MVAQASWRAMYRTTMRAFAFGRVAVALSVLAVSAAFGAGGQHATAVPPRVVHAVAAPSRPVAVQAVPVLNYHHVRVPPRGSNATEVALTVMPDAFAEELALLKTSGWHTVSLGDVMAARSGGALPPNPIVLTFDDSYLDFATVAEPMLRAVGYTSTNYVITGMTGAPDHMPLSLVQAVARRGTVIGGHTVSHPNLTALPAPVMDYELQHSRADLQQWTGQSVSDFAYPYGANNAATQAAAARAGYSTAVATCCGPVTGGSNPYALPRIHVSGGESLGAFASSLGIGLPPPSQAAWWSRLHAVTGHALRGGGVAFAPAPDGHGYGVVRWDGHVDAFGSFARSGSPESMVLSQPMVAAAATRGAGYWMGGGDGGIFNYGDAGFFGSAGALRLNRPVVGMAATPSGQGYWLVASDGGVFSYGDAHFFGSTGAMRLNQPVVGMAATPSGQGYWLVASDGGIFSFGDAVFRGSTGAMRLNQPVVGMATTPSGQGYWLAASDGGIFSFGDAVFRGSTGAVALVRPIVGMAPTPLGAGYWLAASDGGVFTFGDAEFHGSAAG
jgi:peptidoglycan/xylan/chitin deacetylase (PgdA/CDA1 family)